MLVLLSGEFYQIHDNPGWTKQNPLYDPGFVRSLFDEMAQTYGLVNLLTSFGFTLWWRKKCARAISVKPDSVVVDLMAGMGELSTHVGKSLNENGKLIAIDISSEMCRRAERHCFRSQYQVLQADALACPLDDSSVDQIFSTFGLKTFSESQLEQLVAEVARVLKPGGGFSFLEISVPPWWWLRGPYLFYLNRVIPILGRLFLGNPENYRLLGVYTMAFGDCQKAAKLFERSGLEVHPRSYFFGCATGFVGQKPHETFGQS